MLPDRTREYLLIALRAAPRTVEWMAHAVDRTDARWDLAHDGRFTAREAVAHLADWEPIFVERFKQTLHEDVPVLVNVDESALAIERDYSRLDPVESARRFVAGRKATLDFLASIPREDWNRTGIHTKIGAMTIETQIVQMLAHDGYHIEDLQTLLCPAD